MTYYIYHIRGIKIGCTSEPQKRISDQGFTDYEILETHEDIYVASEREKELQREYGYKVDKSPYWQSVKQRSSMGKSGGNITGRIRKNGAFFQSNIQRELSKRPRISYGPGHFFTNEERNKAHNHDNSFKNKRIVCEYCNNPQTTGNYARWHGERCKNKKIH